MAKKILEFFPHKLAARKGGAYTYLYNLKQELKGKDEMEIVFLEDILELEESVIISHHDLNFKNLLKAFIPKKILNNRKVSKYLNNARKSADKNIGSIELNDFDIVHFHEAVDLWRYAHLLENYRGKIFFTPHSPLPYHIELIQEVFGLNGSDLSASVCGQLEEIDQKAFSVAQQFVLPCIEALDGYFSNWPLIEPLLKNKSVHYLLTGCPQAGPTKGNDNALTEYQIPKNSFIVSFTGRHSFIKGYDILEAAAKKILDQHRDIFFLVAGKRTGIERFHHDNWIETGWTDDPAGLINRSDVNIVANRETYFDLNVIEAMSLAKPIILTETGGNRFLKKNINSRGMVFVEFANADSLAKKIESCYQNRDMLAAMGLENKIAYEQDFTSELFYKRYIELYKNI